MDNSCFESSLVMRWPDELREALIASGLLVECEYARVITCDGCEEACLGEVTFVDSDTDAPPRAYVNCHQRDDISRVAVPLEKLRQWTVSVAGFADFLARELHSPHVAKEIIPSWLWWIGRPVFRGGSYGVFLARGTASDDAKRMFSTVPDEAGLADSVILTLSAMPSRDCFPATARIIPLDHILRLDGHSLVVATGMIQLALSTPAKMASDDGDKFRATEDYRCVWLHGKLLPYLSLSQAEVVRILDIARKGGRPVMTHGDILSRMDDPPARMSDIFRSYDPRSVVIRRVGKDGYRLNI